MKRILSIKVLIKNVIAMVFAPGFTKGTDSFMIQINGCVLNALQCHGL